MKEMMKKVLIVDDDVFLTGLYEKLLIKEGLEVAVANSGTAGIEQMAQFRPDLVILDLHMTDMHGKDVLQVIRKDPHLKHLRVIVFATGYIQTLVSTVADLGAYKVLSKMKCKPRALVEEVMASLADMAPAPSAPPAEEKIMTLEAGAAHVDDPGIEQFDLWTERLLTDSREEFRRLCLLHLFRMIQNDISSGLQFDKRSAEYKLSVTLKKLMQDMFDHPQRVTDTTIQSLRQAVEKFLSLTKKRYGTKLDAVAELQQVMKEL